MKFRIKHADKVVGLFILIALLALAAALVFIGLNQRWFAKNYYFKSEFPSASGISPGTAIQLKGFTIGKVSSITLNDKNTVDMEFHVFDTFIAKVRRNSVLELASSPIGLGSQLLLHPGKSEELAEEFSFVPNLASEEGAALAEAELVDIPIKDDTITRLMSNVNPLLENSNRLVVSLNKTTTEINKALQGTTDTPLGKIMDNTGKTMSNLTATMTNANASVAYLKDSLPAMMGEMSELLLSVKLITKNVQDMTEAMKDPTGLIPKLIDPKGSLKTFLDDNNVLFAKVEKMLSDAELIVRNFQRMSESLKAEVPKLSSIMDEGKATLQKAQDVMEGLKNNPLLKGGVPERKEQEASLQSLRDEEF